MKTVWRANILNPSSVFVWLMSVMRVKHFPKVVHFSSPFRNIYTYEKKNNNLCCYFAFNTKLCASCHIYRYDRYTIFNIVPGLTLPYTKDMCLHQKSIIRSYTLCCVNIEERFTSQLHRVTLESIIIERHIYCINGALVQLSVYMEVFSQSWK